MRGLFVILLLIPILSCSQVKKIAKEHDNNTIGIKEQAQNDLESQGPTAFVMFGCIEVPATIDWQEWATYLRNSLVLDGASLDTIPAGTYTVYARFVIDTKGKIGDGSVFKNPGHGLGPRVVKAISQYEGVWEPAKLNGRATFSYHIQPITFIIEAKEDCEDELPAGSIL